MHVVPPIGWKRSAGPQASLSESAVLPPPSEISKPLPVKAKAAAVAPLLPLRPAPAQIFSEIQPRAVAPLIVQVVSPSADTRPSSTIVNTVWTVVFARVKQDWMLYGGGLALGVLSGAAGLWLAVSAAQTTPSGPTDATPPGRATLAQATSAAKQMNPSADPREEMVAFKLSTADAATDPGPQSAFDASNEGGQTAANDPPGDSSLAAPSPAQAATTGEPALARPKSDAPALRLEPAPAAKSATNPAPAEPITTPATAADATAGSDEPSKTRPMATIDPTSVGTAASGRAGRSLSVSEIEERLSSTELPTVQFVQVPLAQFVEFIGDLTTLRITIDDESLKAVGKRRQSPLSIKLTDTTAGKALGAGLKSLGLTCIARDGQLVVTAKGQGTDK